ncbi:hypothetical protein BIZ35_15165 [Heyndrickxia coagulans]|nr:hypothetical protein BIZ35_15165 [Heyndrickxia coagulans]
MMRILAEHWMTKIKLLKKMGAGVKRVKPKARQKGDKYRPVVMILKTKRGLPTKIMVSGQEYALIHKDHYKG